MGQPRILAGLEQTIFGEGEWIVRADDDVIEKAHIDQCQRRAQPLRQIDIGIARLGNASGVVVRNNHGRRTHSECAFDHFADVNRCVRNAAAKKVFLSQHPVAGIEKNGCEHFVIETSEMSP